MREVCRRFSIVLALAALLLVPWAASAQPSTTPTPAQSVLLYRWTDGQGVYHYTDNYNSVPQEYRNSVVRGSFVPEPSRQNQGMPPGAELTGRIDHFDNTYRIESGYLYIQGKVRNGTTATVSSVKVRVTFLNASGGVVRTESTFINPLELPPGAVGSYQLIFKMQPDIATFKTEINWKR